MRSSAPRIEFYLRLPDNHDNSPAPAPSPGSFPFGASPSPCPSRSPSPSAGPGPGPEERRCVDLLRQGLGPAQGQGLGQGLAQGQGLGPGLNVPGHENGWTRQALAQAQGLGPAQEQAKKQEQWLAQGQEQGSALAQEQGPGLTQVDERGQALAVAVTPAPAPVLGSKPHQFVDFPSLVGHTRIGQLFDIVARASELTLAHMFDFQSRRHRWVRKS